MHRVAFALLATLLIASRTASGTSAADWLIHEPAELLEIAKTIILVRVIELKPPSTSATVRVLKSWKGPFSTGRVLHVKEPEVLGCGDCESYTFQAGDKELLMVLFDPEDREPIPAWKHWVWPAAKSQALMQGLDQAVARAP
jgi:hypothetical protein